MRRRRKPPFDRRTRQYIGIRVDGALAAMAGERMRPDGCVEISAVCVNSDHRGKGYAAFLVAWLVHELRGQGVTPHCAVGRLGCLRRGIDSGLRRIIVRRTELRNK
jgi:predicted GNAT family acetyltransferase